ncbi:hypothetical protein NM208_g17044 [Fusarium decemcellulare]|uniref:Uncharacterized protein n=1 Tax=Fusarium decemcellulare TaxID=57161 RepID=A0ACC1RB24_9HYPO|nr:hypothetical protein NM208_g17044 [Fusarium decemcellulare]
MVKRSLTSAIRPLANLRTSAVPVRHFSASPARGLSAIFHETENAELNKTLNEIQEKIILPAYLPPKQRQLVFNAKMRNFIQQNPVIIELDGLEHKFTTINPFKDIPNSKKIFSSALTQMKTREDWENLGTLLAGYKKAGIRLYPEYYARVIRMAGKNNQIYSIIECAKKVQRTGLALNRKDYVALLLSGINNKIIQSGGEKAESLQAGKWAELVLDLIQRPEHMLGNASPLHRLHFNPAIRGLVLFTQGSLAKAQQAAAEPTADTEQSLRENVELIVNAWNRFGTDNLAESPVLADLNPLPFLTRKTTKLTANGGYVSPNHYISALAQNIRGMELAQEFLGDSAKDLKPIQDKLEQHLQQFVKDVPNYREGWGQTYESITGRKPNWSV